jgi:hypothetical protein
MTADPILATLAPVRWEPSCVVPDDPGSITRYPHEPMPADERARWDRDKIERHIAKLMEKV